MVLLQNVLVTQKLSQKRQLGNDAILSIKLQTQFWPMFPYTPIYGNIPYILHVHMPYTMCFVFAKILIFDNNICAVIT